jgi:hypothetical protein
MSGIHSLLTQVWCCRSTRVLNIIPKLHKIASSTLCRRNSWLFMDDQIPMQSQFNLHILNWNFQLLNFCNYEINCHIWGHKQGMSGFGDPKSQLCAIHFIDISLRSDDSYHIKQCCWSTNYTYYKNCSVTSHNYFECVHTKASFGPQR